MKGRPRGADGLRAWHAFQNSAPVAVFAVVHPGYRDATGTRVRRSLPAVLGCSHKFAQNCESVTIVMLQRCLVFFRRHCIQSRSRLYYALNARANPSQGGDAKPPVSNLLVRDSGVAGKPTQ